MRLLRRPLESFPEPNARRHKTVATIQETPRADDPPIAATAAQRAEPRTDLLHHRFRLRTAAGFFSTQRMSRTRRPILWIQAKHFGRRSNRASAVARSSGDAAQHGTILRDNQVWSQRLQYLGINGIQTFAR